MTYIPRSSSSLPDSVGAIPTVVRKKRTFRVFHILASLLFAISIVGAVGVFLLGQYTESKLDEARIALEKASDSNDKQRVDAVGTFDQRLETANILLNQHLAPSKVFNKLEEITKETVQFTSFTYEYEPGFETTLQFSVNTTELSSVALQRLSLAASTIFSEFVMRDIAMESEAQSEEDEEGEQEEVSGVQADFAGVLDTEQFAYTAQSAAPVVEQEVVETTEVATSTEEVIE